MSPRACLVASLALVVSSTAHAEDTGRIGEGPSTHVPGAAATSVPGTEAAPSAPVASASPWREHPLILEGQVALAGPLGGAGLALDYSVTDWFAVNVGAGVGSGASDASLGQRLQYAITPRFRFPVSDSGERVVTAGVEVGVSEGSYKTTFDCILSDECVQKAWKHVLWANTNLFLEVRGDGFQFRAFAGIGAPVTSQVARNCENNTSNEVSCASPSGNPSLVANLGIAVGLPIF